MVNINILRAKLYNFTESELFGRSILVLIVINAIILGMETSDAIMGSIGPFLHMLDRLILAVFVVVCGRSAQTSCFFYWIFLYV